MAEAALVVGAFASSYAGFALIALCQRPHHGAVSASKSRGALPVGFIKRNQALGSLALAVSFALSLLAEGPSFGSILWAFVLAAGALGVMFTLTYRPHWLRPASRGYSPRVPSTR